MSPSTPAIVRALADAYRREQSAREAAAQATTQARDAAQLQLDLLGQLRAAGVGLNVAIRLLGPALGSSIPLARSPAARRALPQASGAPVRRPAAFESVG
jgi:hypothetical protein